MAAHRTLGFVRFPLLFLIGLVSCTVSENPYQTVVKTSFEGDAEKWSSYKPQTMNLRNAEVSFQIRSTGLNLKGASGYFWISHDDSRWQYIRVPLDIPADRWSEPQVLTLEDDERFWQNTWRRSNVSSPNNLSDALTTAFSYGFSFIGFSEEVTGRFEIDNFSIRDADGYLLVREQFDTPTSDWKVYDHSSEIAKRPQLNSVGGVKNSGYMFATESDWSIDTSTLPHTISPMFVVWDNKHAQLPSAIHHKTGGVDSSGHIEVIDSKWSIDFPETPDSILALIRHETVPRDLRNALISTQFRSSKLESNGAKLYFWVLSQTPQQSTRWHLTGMPLDFSPNGWSAPQQFVLHPDPDLWHQSWTKVRSVDDGPSPLTFIGLKDVLANVTSYGFSFVGFTEEVNGSLMMDNFMIRVPKLDSDSTR